MKNACLLVLLLSFPVMLQAQPAQTDADSYTRYELLDPASQRFRIIYDVSATTPGATSYYNTLRKGSEHEVSAVYDLFTGQPLKWKIVDGAYARKNGHPRAGEDTDYLQIILARPVPDGGEARIRIDKTYKDEQSYYTDGNKIIFDRSLSIKRNSIILPKGYEVIACNYPVQVQLEADERLSVSFINRGPNAVSLKITAQPLTDKALAFKPIKSKIENDNNSRGSGPDRSKARLDYNFSERAFQDREIVYYLQQPETHAFRLYHDYTEKRPGVDKYLNVVRAGSKASEPEAYILDTGEKLKVETLRGEAIIAKIIDIGGRADAETEVVVIWFDAVNPGHSTRLRIWETYTDPNRYLLYNNELIWDRSFGRNQNTVVLPEGWYPVANDIPATIDQHEDGRIQLHYVNDRPDNMDVYIKARRK